MIFLLIIIPLISSFIIIIINNNSPQSVLIIKQLSLFVSIITFIISIIIYIIFDSSNTNYQFVINLNYVSYLHIYIGIDNLSIWYILLTTFLTPICILASWNNITHNINRFIACQLIIESLLITLFTVLDLLLFYVAFEAVLIPLFLLVGIWGGSDNRIRAALLLFLYTLAGSLFILVSFIIIFYQVGTTDLITLSLTDVDSNIQRYIWLGIFIALAVKTPLIPVHVWLFRAHSEAPLAGSIVLAGTVLKASTYGSLRVLIPLFPDATSYFIPLVQTICLITLIYASLATIRQVDIKALVAYSSIAHIAVVTIGIFSNTIVGIEGGYLLSLAHGVVSPALFIIVGGIYYDRYHTRILRYYRGITLCIPITSIVFFVAICANIGVPLSLNWLGEFISLAGTYQQSSFIGIIGAITIVLSACYSIWMYARITGGSWSNNFIITTDITRREFIVVIPLLVTAILFGIIPNVILNSIHTSVANIIYTI